MKLFLISLIALCSISKTSAQIKPRDSLQILAIIDDWNKAWQTADHGLATRGYSIDAHFTNAFGDKRNGKEDIEALLKEVFALRFVMAGNSETSEHRYQALNKTTINVHTAVIRKGQQMPDGSVIPDRKTTHMRVFQKVAGKWQIKAHLISDARDKQIPKH